MHGGGGGYDDANMPPINVSGSYTGQRLSENAVTLPSGPVSGGTTGGERLSQDLFQTGFD
jgi:hypothetical protein